MPNIYIYIYDLITVLEFTSKTQVTGNLINIKLLIK
jgi:hypothetical protein